MKVEIVTVDTKKLRDYPNSARVISLMTMANDMERIAYLRLLNEMVNLKGYEYLSQHVGSYTAMMLCAHLYEALLLIENMRGLTNLRNFMDSDADLSRLYGDVKIYYDNHRLFGWCERIRNLISFHYKHNAAELQTAMEDIIAAGYKTDVLIIGKDMNSPTSHETGMNAMDAMFLSIIGGKYTGKSAAECNGGAGCQPHIDCNHRLAQAFIQELETAQRRVRFFADAFIKRFVSHVNTATPYDIGYLQIKWTKKKRS